MTFVLIVEKQIILMCHFLQIYMKIVEEITILHIEVTYTISTVAVVCCKPNLLGQRFS